MLAAAAMIANGNSERNSVNQQGREPLAMKQAEDTLSVNRFH
jgi:hypothetical protein